MMGVAGILRRKMSQKLLAKNDLLCFDAFTCHAGISTSGKNVGPNDRVHATYSIYKGKAALSVRPVPPTFSRLDSGSLKVDRHGVMMLTFTPAVAERKYDWDKKQFFALSPTEAGSLISLSHNDSCEFFHDPSMKTSYAGQVRKNLSIKPSPGGSGYFFSLSVVNNVVQTSERFTVPVTPAEFAVLRTAFSVVLQKVGILQGLSSASFEPGVSSATTSLSFGTRYALPHIMGWDMYINQQSTGSKGIVHKKGALGEASTNAFNTTDLEWEK